MKKAIIILIIPLLLAACTPKAVTDEQGRREIVLATVFLDPYLEKQVMAFNETNPDYYIMVDDYYQAATPGVYYEFESYLEGLRRLDVAIAKGSWNKKTPDIFVVSSDSYHKYAQKDLFADLTGLFAEDVDATAIYENVLNTLRLEEKLYGIAPFFTVFVVCRDEMMADWDMSMEATAALQKEADYSIMGGGTPGVIFNQWLWMYMNNFIDWTAYSCDFNHPDFIAILEMMKDAPARWEEVTIFEPISERQPLILTTAITNALNYQVFHDLFAGRMVVSGYPGQEAVFEVSMNDIVSIAKKSPYKEAAWDFLRGIISDENQAKIRSAGYIPSIPISRSAVQAEMSQLASPAPGRSTTVRFDDDVEVSADHVTAEAMEGYAFLLEGYMVLRIYDNTPRSIVAEEAAAYFEGDMPLEAVIDNINSRVRLYLNELRQ